jgi:hypothetical protein
MPSFIALLIWMACGCRLDDKETVMDSDREKWIDIATVVLNPGGMGVHWLLPGGNTGRMPSPIPYQSE